MDQKNDVDRIYQEVEKRKRRAEELGVPKLFEKLYSRIPHYPSWIKNNHNREWVCSLVTDAIKMEDGGIKIVLSEETYTFYFKESNFSTPDGEYHKHANWELYVDSKKVLVVDMAYEMDQYIGGNWTAFGVSAFIEGDWLKDFKKLEQKIVVEDKEREQKRKSKEAEKLKEDFGIN
jgi:hypothetical protein